MYLYLFIALFLALYGGIGFYIGLRGAEWLAAVLPRPVPPAPYWAAVLLLATAFPLARVGGAWLPLWVSEALARIGAWWMTALVYLFPALLLVDVARLMYRGARLLAPGVFPPLNLVKVTGAVLLAAYAAVVIYGAWAARSPVVTRYEVTIPKHAGKYRELNVVLVSDTHLGLIIGRGRLERLVADVNRLGPDLVLLAGDIIDDDFRPFQARQMAGVLRGLDAPLGVYSVLGNHDAGSDDLPMFRAAMAEAGIRLLVDEWVAVDDAFYVVGRNDRSHQRASLQDVLHGVDPSRPVLVMDHQPDRLEEAVAAGVDLQVSGHTHRGQVWPGRLITDRIFEVDWGYLRKGNTQFIVSQGWGTWGPPIRVGSRSEIVQITIRFAQ
ncbi:metallophosphoesterase [Symbiobacterium thermophilum]|uniref:metallophosphoesterase n=1 Tax=Symbiobacterium thermophilum TaxID=2734 RepID=UPI0002DE6042|nr:metallophosphoesterase [Symbiobacterium thermophilum]